MRTILFLLPAFFFSAFTAYSQKQYFVKATIVKNGGDRLSGYIERDRDSQLSEAITFEQELNSKEKQTFTPGDLISFTLQDENATYEALRYTNYQQGKATPEKRFANLVLKGYCSLYALELQDDEISIIFEPNNTHIFLAKKGDSVTVLKETETMIGNSYKLDKDYIERMKSLFSDCNNMDESMIAATQFYKKALVKIFETYNLCIRPQSQPQTFKTAKSIKINPGVYIDYITFSAKHSNNANGFATGFFIELLRPSANERFSFSAGVEYENIQADFAFDSTATTRYSRETEQLQNFCLPLKATYYLNKKKIAPFLNFGVTPALVSLKSTPPVSFSDGNFEKGWLLYGSFGPGLLVGKVYGEFLVEKEGIITTERGTFFRIRLGVLF